MNYRSREDMLSDLQQSFHTLMTEFDLDDIGLFEEQGAHDQYYAGYTINKDGKTYMVHRPYRKNEQGGLAELNADWTLETDEPNHRDEAGFASLEKALKNLH